MTLGVSYGQSLLSGRVPNKPGGNESAIARELSGNISQQVLESFEQFFSDVKKYDRATKNTRIPARQFTNSEAPDASQQAVNFAFNPVAGFKNAKYMPGMATSDEKTEDSMDTMMAEIDSLIQQCYSGNSGAFKKLVDYSKGKLTLINGMLNGDNKFDEVFTKAKNAIYTLIDEAPAYPSMFQMITESGLLDEKEFGEAANLPAKLINEAATSTIAMQQLKKLLSSGTFRLEDYGKKAIELNPEYAVTTLVNLSQDNKSKDQGITIANLLADVAANSPGSNAGAMAAKGLKKMVKSEGQNSILKAAFDGLTKAAIAGNTEALKSLEDLVLDPTISKNKAMQAVDCLTKVAMSGSGSGGEATKMLANLARNKRLAPQIREKVVDGLTQVAASGNGNAAVAADALLELAKFPNDPIGKKALANITSMKNTDMMDQGKLNEVLQNAATSNKTDVPMKKTAQMMLENSAKANPFNTKKQSGQNNNPNEGNNIFLNIDTNQQQARSVEQKQNKTLFSSASPNKGAMPRAEYNPFMVA